jgi:hypothetical protein
MDKAVFGSGAKELLNDNLFSWRLTLCVGSQEKVMNVVKGTKARKKRTVCSKKTLKLLFLLIPM